MSDIFFVLRMMVLTFVVVTLMQIKVGPSTIEQHSQEWLRSSPAIATLQGVADGAIHAATKAFKFASNQLDSNFGKKFKSENQPGTRISTLAAKRSQEFVKKEEAKAEAKIESIADSGVEAGLAPDAAVDVGGIHIQSKHKRSDSSATDKADNK